MATIEPRPTELFTSRAEVESLLSAAGVNLRIDDDYSLQKMIPVENIEFLGGPLDARITAKQHGFSFGESVTFRNLAPPHDPMNRVVYAIEGSPTTDTFIIEIAANFGTFAGCGTVAPLTTISTAEEDKLLDAIEEATEEAYALLRHTYGDITPLCENRWVRRSVSYVAAHILSRRLGNDGLFCAEYEKYMAQFAQVKAGDLLIPRMVPTVDKRPYMMNLTVDRNFRHRQLRQDPSTSVGPTGRDVDYGYGGGEFWWW